MDHEGIRYEGEVDNEGRRDGRGIGLYPDGTLYEGYFVEGKRQGKGRSTKVNLEVYTGEWYNDLFHGFGICKYGPNSILKGWYGKGYFFKNSDNGYHEIKHASGLGY